MNCDCISDVELKIKSRIEQKMPDGSRSLELNFPQFRFGMTDRMDLVRIISLDVKGQYQAPKKSGGMKRVKVDTFIAATYCPFCGTKCCE